jgi:uncharacterized protein (DUF1501 family)
MKHDGTSGTGAKDGITADEFVEPIGGGHAECAHGALEHPPLEHSAEDRHAVGQAEHERAEFEKQRPLTISRRKFLGSTAAGAAVIASAPAWLPRVSYGTSTGPSRDTLVVIFLRGGADGLTLCVPYGDANLYNLRPTISVRPPGQTDGATDLDGFFGLAPAMVPLLPAYQAGHLAFVHATGLSDPSRSHFDMQKWMEYGVTSAQSAGITTGWIGRYMQTIAPAGAGLLRGLGIGSLLPRSFSGAPASIAVADPDNFTIGGTASTISARRAVLTAEYAHAPDPMGYAATNTFDTIDLLGLIDFVNYTPANGAVYPATTSAQALKRAAALIKAQVGVEVIEVDLTGWDLHSSLGPITGSMSARMDELAGGLSAFYSDLNDAAQTLSRVTLVTMSEFGRRAGQNGSSGADHGHGNCMIVMGGHVNGGQVLTTWPGLAPANLDNGDLAITVDYRDILSEILTERMACTHLTTVFPGWTPTRRGITT